MSLMRFTVHPRWLLPDGEAFGDTPTRPCCQFERCFIQTLYRAALDRSITGAKLRCLTVTTRSKPAMRSRKARTDWSVLEMRHSYRTPHIQTLYSCVSRRLVALNMLHHSTLGNEACHERKDTLLCIVCSKTAPNVWSAAVIASTPSNNTE